MVRKQLYITDEQERALKRRAKEEGLSEAELTRRALDRMLHGEERRTGFRANQALQQLLDRTRRAAERHRLPDRYHFDRAALYAERERRSHGGGTS